MDRDEGGKGRAGARQRLEDQHGVEPAEPGAADIVADIDAAEAERSGLADHVGGEMVVPVPFERIGRDAVGGEGLRHVLDGALVLVEFELAGGSLDGGVHGVLPVRFLAMRAANLDQ